MQTTKLPGYYFDGASSKRIATYLVIDSEGYVTIDESPINAMPYSTIKTSLRVGNTPRHLNFPDGSSFESEENDQIDQLNQLFGQKNHANIIHRLETSLKFACIALVATIAITWGFIQYGIPALSTPIANLLPTTITDELGRQSLEYIDQTLFEPSQLTTERKSELEKLFKQVIPSNSPQKFSLIFRQSPVIGPNALALPSGHIIFTDEIIQLAEDDHELEAVMAHETGHVINKHTLRGLIQKSALAIAVVAITGDVSTASSLIIALPALILETGYSREFEREADQYAIQYMDDKKIDRQYFATILGKLEKVALEEESEKQVTDSLESPSWQGYLSSHPATEERIKALLTKN